MAAELGDIDTLIEHIAQLFTSPGERTASDHLEFHTLHAIGDFSARVPIIIADPRIRGPRKITEVVRTVDIAPTLLELAGLPVPDFVQGVSLVPLMRGESLEMELPAFNETGVWLTDLPGTPTNGPSTSYFG